MGLEKKLKLESLTQSLERDAARVLGVSPCVHGIIEGYIAEVCEHR